MRKYNEHVQDNMMRGIENRKRVYRFLVDYITENLYPPSFKEICEGTGLRSTSSVHNHLQILELVGKIEVRDWLPWAIKLVGYKFVKDGD